MSHRVLKSSIVVGLVVAGAAVLVAGPLDPPAGPVGGTYKTLSEVEPRIAINATNTPGDNDGTPSVFKITVAGSYYLPANVTVASGRIGIEIEASPVTIDLRGFVVHGQPGAGDGIGSSLSFGTGAMIIRNGSITNCANGIMANQPNTVIEGIAVDDSVGWGIYAGSSAVVSHCVVSGGESGIRVGFNSNVLDCAVSNTAAVGITTYNGSTVTNCSSFGNGTLGISAGIGNTIAGCSADNNLTDGISTGNGCTITGCSANSNHNSGLFVSFYCSAFDCTVTSNGFDGIAAGQGCQLRGNTCNGNGTDPAGGAGIHVTATDCRLEGNVCNQNDRGIDIDFAGNLVIRNSCAGNTTDWDIVANNVVGPIIDRRAPASAAVVGFSFAGSLGSIDPNANFSY